MTEYVELHAHSYFSLLDGASSPEALVARAAALEMPALALTDHDAVYGAVRFVQAARAQGIRPILGAELTLSDSTHLTLLVENAAGWHNLCRLISLGRHNAPKGDASLPVEALADHTVGLLALSGCREGAVARALRRGDQRGALAAAGRLREWFGRDRVWIELQHHLRPDDNALLDGLVTLARRLGLGMVATNNVHYAEREAHPLQDVLVAIRHLTTLDAASPLRRPNSEYYLKDGRRLAPLFADTPEALANTLEIAGRCAFDLQYGLQDLPTFPTPPGMDAAGYLRKLCEEALRVRYGTPSSEVQTRLAYELAVIGRARLDNYFLIVWDIVRFARTQGIRCQGRGSAANSLVAYLLGITPIDPLAHNLVFERFLSDERQIAPDIDIDFQADRREEVIQYVYERYGAAHTAMACTFVTFRARSALRDVGKALGLPLHLLDRATRVLDIRRSGALGESASLQDTFTGQLETPAWRQLLDLCAQIDGLPRHLSIHNGGMLLTGSPLAARVPTEPATMPGRVVVQWDKDALEDAGLVKIDLLGLRMLSVVAEAVEQVEKATGERPDLDALAFDDPAIFAMIAEGDTVGIFQVESRAQAQMQPVLQPRSFADLVIAISLIRPGPLQGDMVHPYLRRRNGQEPVRYPHPSLKPALRETLGVILFQEQVLKVTRDLAGFSAGQGELLRRALGRQDAAVLDDLQTLFVDKALAKGVPQETAQEVFDVLRAFGGYSFPKSHAAAFAVLVYQSAWLKRYHPAALFAALLNHQPMGFWSPAILIGDAKRHGVEMRPVDIARSMARCTVEDRHAVRLGFQSAKGLGKAAAERLVAVRDERPFHDLADLVRRAQLTQRQAEHLILAGALDGWHVPRRKLLWELGTLRWDTPDGLPLDFADEELTLPALSPLETLAHEHEVLGLSTGEHVTALYRSWLRERGLLSSADLRACADGAQVRVAGIVAVHQAPPTAKGFHFITLEDEFGLMDVIVRPDVYQQYAGVLRTSGFLAVSGVLQRNGAVLNVLAQHAVDVRLATPQA